MRLTWFLVVLLVVGLLACDVDAKEKKSKEKSKKNKGVEGDVQEGKEKYTKEKHSHQKHKERHETKEGRAKDIDADVAESKERLQRETDKHEYKDKKHQKHREADTTKHAKHKESDNKQRKKRESDNVVAEENSRRRENKVKYEEDVQEEYAEEDTEAPTTRKSFTEAEVSVTDSEADAPYVNVYETSSMPSDYVQTEPATVANHQTDEEIPTPSYKASKCGKKSKKPSKECRRDSKSNCEGKDCKKTEKPADRKVKCEGKDCKKDKYKNKVPVVQEVQEPEAVPQDVEGDCTDGKHCHLEEY